MSELNIDTMLAIVGNPTRRQILRKLSKESHYPLQLSRELNISQQSIMKHLAVLEDNDLVVSIIQKSDSGGPPRKYYTATKRLSIIIDIAPTVFHEEFRLLEPVTDSDVKELLDMEMNNSNRTVEKRRLMELTARIYEINSKIKAVEEERYRLMGEKERAVKLAYRLVDVLCDDYNQRAVLRYIMEYDELSIARMSEMLNMREAEVEAAVKNLEQDGLLRISR